MYLYAYHITSSGTNHWERISDDAFKISEFIKSAPNPIQCYNIKIVWFEIYSIYVHIFGVCRFAVFHPVWLWLVVTLVSVQFSFDYSWNVAHNKRMPYNILRHLRLLSFRLWTCAKERKKKRFLIHLEILHQSKQSLL